MIVLSLKRLILSLIFILTATILVIAVGLSLIGGTDWFLKLNIQNFFFWGVIALLIQIWLGGSLFLSHRKILRSINRLSSLEDLSGFNAEKTFREMGEIGEAIKWVLKDITQISTMRYDRISALNNLTLLLSKGYSEPAVITDVNGEIFAKSEKFEGRVSDETEGRRLTNILNIRPEIKLPEVLTYIETTGAAWTSEEVSKITCTPVFDKKNIVHFCIWEFELSFFAEKLKEFNMSNSKNLPPSRKIRDIVKPFRRTGRNRKGE